VYLVPQLVVVAVVVVEQAAGIFLDPVAAVVRHVMMVMALLVASRVDPVEWEKKQIG